MIVFKNEHELFVKAYLSYPLRSKYREMLGKEGGEE